MKDIDYINEFRKMKTLTSICREIGCDRPNLIRGKEPKYESLVAKIIKCEIIRMYNMIVTGEKNEY